MSRLLGFLRELAGLFVDDGRLAIAILLVLAATRALLGSGRLGAQTTMLLLVGGVVAALLENVVRAARIASKKE